MATADTTTVQITNYTRDRLRRCGGTVEEAITRLLDEHEDAEFEAELDAWIEHLESMGPDERARRDVVEAERQDFLFAAWGHGS
jgi:hypothetical protein